MQKHFFSLFMSLFFSLSCYAEEAEKEKSPVDHSHENPVNDPSEGKDDQISANDDHSPSSNSRWYKDSDARKAYLRGDRNYRNYPTQESSSSTNASNRQNYNQEDSRSSNMRRYKDNDYRSNLN